MVVAHPDDETLWFSSVIGRRRADVLCVTSSEQRGVGARRSREFRQACALLGAASAHELHHPDRAEQRLDLARLGHELQAFARGYDEVFTHALLGEAHEHPHHQDVCCAVHRCFANVWSNAWNQYPALRQELTAAEYALKKEILGTVYWREYAKLRATYEIGAVESFCQHDRAGVEAFRRAVSATPRGESTLVFDNPLRRESGEQAAECHRRLGALLLPHAPRRLLGVGMTSSSLRRLLQDSLCAVALADLVDGGTDCDSVIAAFDSRATLEGSGLLRHAAARHLLLVSPARRETAALLELLQPRYALVQRELVPPRWEPLHGAGSTGQPEVYKSGVLLSLLEHTPRAR